PILSFPPAQKSKSGGAPTVLMTTHDGMDFVFLRFRLSGEKNLLIIGRRLHPGMEQRVRQFTVVHSRSKKDSAWREKIPYRLRLWLGLVYVVLVCLSLIMAWVIARRISLPIVSLAQATRDVTDGKLDTRLDIQAQGELGILIDSFNQMT